MYALYASCSLFVAVVATILKGACCPDSVRSLLGFVFYTVRVAITPQWLSLSFSRLHQILPISGRLNGTCTLYIVHLSAARVFAVGFLEKRPQQLRITDVAALDSRTWTRIRSIFVTRSFILLQIEDGR